MLVDTIKKTKVPLFDPASMAAQLTNIVRVPFDSAHLPLLDDEADQEGHGRSSSS